MGDFDCCSPRQGGHDVPDPAARALSKALWRNTQLSVEVTALRKRLAELEMRLERITDGT